ncbi:hypothetical protein ACTJKO_07275 [Curtobacterium sp. 22159]|uniref:hypothetical protein n=1 Tax=Curtobacterium sp. 22159 TaxID=3453882 RepID=UPI003F860F5E
MSITLGGVALVATPGPLFVTAGVGSKLLGVAAGVAAPVAAGVRVGSGIADRPGVQSFP